MLFPNGNIIISNKYDTASRILTYEHYKIVKNENGYSLVKGKTWSDGFNRIFKISENDQIIEVILCSNTNKSYYNCQTFELENDLSLKLQ